MEKTKVILRRIDKALFYIDANLDSSLSLGEVASVACYSSFHFHRLFSAVIGETLNGYIQRRKMEKAALYLLSSSDLTLAELGQKLGFDNPSSFSRNFKKFYGKSPTEFRKSAKTKFSKIRTMESKEGIAWFSLEEYISNMKDSIQFIEKNAEVVTKIIGPLHLAYIGYIGHPNGIGKAYDELLKWAYPKGFIDANTKMVTIYHNSPKTTAMDKMEMSACMILQEDARLDAEIGERTITAGKYVILKLEIQPEALQNAWESAFVWLAEKGFRVREMEPFELYHNDFRSHPEKKCFVDFYIPVL